MDHAVPGELQREAPNRLSKASYERSGRDRGKDASTHERAQHLRVAVEGRTPLGVRQQNAVAAVLQIQQKDVQAARHRGEGRLHEQPGTFAQAEVRVAAAARAIATEPSIVSGPSSMPGSTWQWRSITDLERR